MKGKKTKIKKKGTSYKHGGVKKSYTKKSKTKKK